jgi:hypothetical protein
MSHIQRDFLEVFMSNQKRPTIFNWLWPHVEFDFSKARPLGRIAGAALVVLIIVLAVGIVGVLATFIAAVFHLGPYQEKATDEAIRNIGLFIAAVIGVPFIAWRSWTAKRQADITEQGHITDRINKAVQGIGAEKTVRRQRTNRRGSLLFEDDAEGKPNFKKPVFDELTVPNLEVRIGSIYALERVGNDSEPDRAHIFEILSAYLSNNFDAQEPFPYPPLERFSTDEHDPNLDVRFRGQSDGLGRDWANKLRRPRPDTLAAVSVILRCIKKFGTNEKEGGTPALTFVGANLQRVDFLGANLAGARFEGCQFDGANLEKSDLSNAEFLNCSLIGASINGAVLSGTRFSQSRLECINAGNIKSMSGCSFWDCDCSGSMFDDSDLSETHFVVTARKASFRAKKMNNTHFSMCDIRDGEVSAFSMHRLNIHATWVPETGVQLMERVQQSKHASTTRMAKKARLFVHPSNAQIASSNVSTASFMGMMEVEQGDAELFDSDAIGPTN